MDECTNANRRGVPRDRISVTSPWVAVVAVFIIYWLPWAMVHSPMIMIMIKYDSLRQVGTLEIGNRNRLIKMAGRNRQ